MKPWTRRIKAVLSTLAFTTGLLMPSSVPPALASNPIACGPIDLAFVVDNTGSMQGTLANVKAGIGAILAEVEQDSGGDYQLGLVSFGDSVSVDVPLAAENRLSIEKAMANLTMIGGGDGPEASDEALRTVVGNLASAGRAQHGDFTAPFRTEATRVAVLITDARPGGFSDRYVEGVDDRRASSIANEAKAIGIKVAAVFVPTSGDAVARRIMQQYASVTGGGFVQTAADGTGTASAIRDLIAHCGGAPGGVSADSGDAIMQNLANTLSPFFMCIALAAATIALGLSMVRRNTVAHAIDRFFGWVAEPIALACDALARVEKKLDEHTADSLAKWPDWASPARTEKSSSQLDRVSVSPWHGWELLNWLVYLATLPFLFSADLILAGLAATYLLGLSLGNLSSEPVLFGLTTEALLFALVGIVPLIVFAAVLFDIHGAGTGAARPFGNASARVRTAVSRVSVFGIVLCLTGVLAFALYRADLVSMSIADAASPASDLVVGLPYVFLPIFALTTAGATALAFWSVFVGLAALYVMAVMIAVKAISILRVFVVHPIHRVVDGASRFAIGIWDVLCRPVGDAWNFMLGGQTWRGREVPRTPAYCTFQPADHSCQLVSQSKAARPAVCHCRHFTDDNDRHSASMQPLPVELAAVSHPVHEVTDVTAHGGGGSNGKLPIAS